MLSYFKSKNVAAFDAWIRSDFKAMNSELEELYFAQEDRLDIQRTGENIKQELLAQGNRLIAPLLAEGNTDDGFDQAFDLLGNVGFFMAACRRHELTNPELETRSPLVEASALAMQLGASLGVIPRFASAHLETHNRAENGTYHTFTDLADEKVFLDFNTRAVFSYMRAAQALVNILPLGVSHPVTYDLLVAAREALLQVVESNSTLFQALNDERFFYCIRPYYKPHRVGLREYRGANAGDFSGINVLDLLLGLCKADDPYYSQILVDKFLYMRPEDQLLLRDCMRRRSLLEEFLHALDNGQQSAAWYNTNLKVFLQVCDAHGAAATLHHDQLVHKFIEIPADRADLHNRTDLTASGPPLPVLLKSLRKLRDLRNAARSEEHATQFAQFEKLRNSIGV